MFSRPRLPTTALLTDSPRLYDDARVPRDEDVWDAWMFAAADAHRALQSWHAANPADRGDAYAAYHAALDREEQGAYMLQRHCGSRRRV
jgi:hypothetical protein